LLAQAVNQDLLRAEAIGGIREFLDHHVAERIQTLPHRTLRFQQIRRCPKRTLTNADNRLTCQDEAVQTVLKQAELLSDEWTFEATR